MDTIFFKAINFFFLKLLALMMDCLPEWPVLVEVTVKQRLMLANVYPTWGRRPYLHLLERNLKAEGLVVVRIQSVLLHRRLLLLQPLSVLQQVNLHVGIWRREEVEVDTVKDLLKGHVQLQLQCPGSPTDGASAEAGCYCMVSAAVSVCERPIGWARRSSPPPFSHSSSPGLLQSNCQHPHLDERV